MTTLRLSLLLAGLALASPAQVDPFTWVPFPDAVAGTSVLGVFDSTGFPINSFTLPSTAVFLAKAANGTVWVRTGTGLEPYDSTGPTGPAIPLAGGAVAVASTGDIWTFSPGTAFTPGVLQRRDAMGATLQTFIPPLATIQGMQADPFGDVWLMCAVTNQVFRYTPSFAAFTFLFGATGAVAIDWEIDPQGRPWILTPGPPGQVSVIRLDTNGATTLSTTFNTGLPTGIKVDGCGRVRVLRTLSGQQQEVVTLDDLGATIDTVSLPSIAPATRELVGFDARGRALLRNGTNLELFDDTGTLAATIVSPLGVPFTAAGDLTSLRLLSVVDRGGDGDLDGVPNGTEFEIGADPTSTLTPLQLVAAPPPAIGASFGLTLSAPAQVGALYLIGASGATTGIPVGPTPSCPRVPLALDPLLQFWFDPANPFVTNATGFLDVSGNGTATVNLPQDPALSGFGFFAAGVTVDPSAGAIASITAPLSLSIP